MFRVNYSTLAFPALPSKSLLHRSFSVIRSRDNNMSASPPPTSSQFDNGPNMSGHEKGRNPKLLCLHGFRTSAAIFKKQIYTKWPDTITQKLDLVFVDAPFPSQGKSDVEGLFDPPYYEWYQSTKDFADYLNFEECLAYIENCMLEYGPFDGLLGFSQGAILSGALPGLQAKGLALAKVDKIKFLIIIGGAKSKNPSVAAKSYSQKIQIPSVHFLGEKDFLRGSGIQLLESFIDPVVIKHPQGHTIPRFDEKNLEKMQKFVERIQKQVARGKE